MKMIIIDDRDDRDDDDGDDRQYHLHYISNNLSRLLELCWWFLFLGEIQSWGYCPLLLWDRSFLSLTIHHKIVAMTMIMIIKAQKSETCISKFILNLSVFILRCEYYQQATKWWVSLLVPA